MMVLSLPRLSCIRKVMIPDIDFIGMTLIRLSKLISGACQFPVKAIYFLIPGRELSNGLKGFLDSGGGGGKKKKKKDGESPSFSGGSVDLPTLSELASKSKLNLDGKLSGESGAANKYSTSSLADQTRLKNVELNKELMRTVVARLRKMEGTPSHDAGGTFTLSSYSGVDTNVVSSTPWRVNDDDIGHNVYVGTSTKMGCTDATSNVSDVSIGCENGASNVHNDVNVTNDNAVNVASNIPIDPKAATSSSCTNETKADGKNNKQGGVCGTYTNVVSTMNQGPIIMDWTVDDGDVNLNTCVTTTDPNTHGTTTSNVHKPMSCGTSDGKANSDPVSNVPKTTNVMGSTSFANVLSPERVTRKAIRNDINMAAEASTTMEKTNDGFREVQNRKAKGKKVGVQMPQKQMFRGIDVGKGVNFRPSKPKQVNTPSFTKIETKINDLKLLVLSSETIQSCLVGLAELYVSIDELVQSPQTKQAFSRKQNGTLVEDILEGSIGLLDLCCTLKEMAMLMKENTQILQSALRRKGGDSIAASQISVYLCFKKKAKKSIVKSLETLKHLEKKMGSFLFLDADHHVLTISKVLGEVNSLTISIFKCLLIFMSTKSKPVNGVHLLSKFLSKSSSTHYNNSTFVNEVETVDMAITSLHRSARNNEMKNVEVQMSIKKLQILDVTIDGIETGLALLFRRLVQSRASLLNIVVGIRALLKWPFTKNIECKADFRDEDDLIHDRPKAESYKKRGERDILFITSFCLGSVHDDYLGSSIDWDMRRNFLFCIFERF
ncbi:hypothetical protein CTI12_AA245230 [Artemisia annua]|uniref:Uncharacterized protein n=1 Tax=Artemisia annua TaxID=35608 RepID=A0A2U1MNW2_ARTAN|nr:hypothetical protein CTI12_AA245230 [Artemisia annua]